MKFACCAVVGKGNNPLCLKTFVEKEKELKFHYIVHTSLDIVAEKMASGRSPESFLGLLFPTEDYQVYGYVTNTKVKLIIVVYDTSMIDNPKMKAFFKQFHALYIDSISNPFHVLDEPLKSAAFDRGLLRLTSKYSAM